MEKNIIVGIVIIVMVMLLVYMFSTGYDIYGVWSADESFLDDAGLTELCLFVGDPLSGFSSKRSGYLYAANKDGAIEDQRIEMNMSSKWSGDALWYNIMIEPVNTWGDGKVVMRVCPKRNLMTIMQGDIIYAELYKDNILTDHARTVDVNADSMNHKIDTTTEEVTENK